MEIQYLSISASKLHKLRGIKKKCFIIYTDEESSKQPWKSLKMFKYVANLGVELLLTLFSQAQLLWTITERYSLRLKLFDLQLFFLTIIIFFHSAVIHF